MKELTLVKKILHDEVLSSEEVQRIVYSDFSEEENEKITIVDYVEFEDLDWVKPVQVIFQIENLFFGVEYYRGLGGNQPDEFEAQSAIRVVPHERQIIVKEWIEYDSIVKTGFKGKF